MVRYCFILGFLFFVGCKTSTQIISIPEGASLFISGRYYGETPCKVSTTQSKEDKMRLVIEKEGFFTMDTSIYRNGKVNKASHVLGWLFVFPFHYDRNFKAKYVFKLSDAKTSILTSDSLAIFGQSNMLKIRALQEAYKQGRISKSDFETQKKIIISGQQ